MDRRSECEIESDLEGVDQNGGDFVCAESQNSQRRVGKIVEGEHVIRHTLVACRRLNTVPPPVVAVVAWSSAR